VVIQEAVVSKVFRGFKASEVILVVEAYRALKETLDILVAEVLWAAQVLLVAEECQDPRGRQVLDSLVPGVIQDLLEVWAQMLRHLKHSEHETQMVLPET
jgi:hypothetical protein